MVERDIKPIPFHSSWQGDGAVQKGMPHKLYHGKTGRVYNVTQHAVGIIVNKRVGWVPFALFTAARSVDGLLPGSCRTGQGASYGLKVFWLVFSYLRTIIQMLSLPTDDVTNNELS